MRRFTGIAWLLLGVVLGGCAPSKLVVRPIGYDVDVRLDPASHRLTGRASVRLEPVDAGESPRRRARVDLELNPDLEVLSVEADGATFRAHRIREPRRQPEEGIAPTTHRLVLENPGGDLRLTLAYAGALEQDVAAGEEEGEIHNFAVSAHVAPEGIYLEPDGYWYPRVDLPDGADPAFGLADFRLTVDPIEGFELVAGLEHEAGDDRRLHWASPFPLDGIVLLGGPLERQSRRHGDVMLHAVLAPGKGTVAEDILDASAEYLDRYQSLVGPYPFREFTVLEAFFSSGFAFPTCTQIAGSQLSEYKQYRRHGYLDHELLHNWWGNGIFVDPRDGNWCEGLASYMGNYYGFVLDGDAAGARKQRRNQSNFLSAVEAEDDKPLGSFGLPDGAGRGIGYQKGAAVFHMLERKIGPEALSAGLRRLTREHMGKFASWKDLQRAFEEESGVDLEGFFHQWVERGGAPLLGLEHASWTPGSEQLEVTISQGGTDFVLDVPLRLHYEDRTEDVVVVVDESTDVVEVPCAAHGLTAVELDPDYHVFRKLRPDEAMPTSSLTRRGERLVILVPEGELAEGYRIVLDSYSRSILGEPDEPNEGHEVVILEPDEVGPDDLERTNVLVLGDAVRNPIVEEFLERTRAPVSWEDAGFVVDSERYAGPGQAVFFTVHHPDLEQRGVTVYYGNTSSSLANARVLGFYPNSLLVFESPVGAEADAAAPSEMPPSRVLHRMDFEFHDRIEF